MILTFSKPEFVDRIIAGTKIHTIREDLKERWKKDMKIHFWLHNPRNVKQNPHTFANGKVISVFDIWILPDNDYVLVMSTGINYKVEFKTQSALNAFAINDGFDSWEDMKKWFKTDFRGRIINFKVTEVLPCSPQT